MEIEDLLENKEIITTLYNKFKEIKRNKRRLRQEQYKRYIERQQIEYDKTSKACKIPFFASLTLLVVLISVMIYTYNPKPHIWSPVEVYINGGAMILLFATFITCNFYLQWHCCPHGADFMKE